MKQLKETLVELVPDNIAVYFNVFRALMEDVIGDNLYSRVVIVVNYSQLNGENTEVMENIIQPLYFTGDSCYSLIFSF